MLRRSFVGFKRCLWTATVPSERDWPLSECYTHEKHRVSSGAASVAAPDPRLADMLPSDKGLISTQLHRLEPVLRDVCPSAGVSLKAWIPQTCLCLTSTRPKALAGTCGLRNRCYSGTVKVSTCPER